MTNPMLKAALAYAKLGWPIHPIWWIKDGRCACGQPEGACKPGKHPILKDWPARATTDPTLIERWFARYPNVNIAVATGPKSGIFVLDIDGAEGERTLVDLEHRLGDMPERYVQQWTGGDRNGWQAFFAWPEGRMIRNSAGRLGPKLDTRGEGGYVLLPPSLTTKRYRWAQERDPWSLPNEPAPAWLIDLLDPPAPPEPLHRPTFSSTTYRSPNGEDRYADKALVAELALVALAPEGMRNDQLNASAHALFRLVKDGRLYHDIVERGLIEASRHAGLHELEARRTIASAAKARGL